MNTRSTYSSFLLPLCLVLLVLHANWSNAMNGDKSYLDDIRLSYENETWTCNRLICAIKTFGCEIERRTDPYDDSRINNINSCINMENGIKAIRATIRWVEVKPLSKKLDFFIRSFIDSPTVCSYGCSLSHQFFNGTVNVTDWPSIQEDARRQAEEVGASVVSLQ